MSEGALSTRTRLLPRGWLDFLCQFAIWFGFLGVYEIVRGFAGGDRSLALAHGEWVIHIEERLGDLFEPTVQKMVAASRLLELAVSWTYWLSEFAVLGGALLWVYLRRYEHFRRLRNWVLVADGLGLIGYFVFPTAPPRMFAGQGFEDTLAKYASLNHGNGLIQVASNQYAAMPSLHAADALIVGLTLAVITRHWWAKTLSMLWPAWVCFSLIATGNHFWLDCAVGVVVALATGYLVHRRELRRWSRRSKPRAGAPASHAGA